MDYSAIFSAGLNFVNGIIGSSIAKNNSLELMRAQNDYNWKALMEQERYNSAPNQVALYRQAGLNPNLLGGATSQASLSSSGSASSPNADLGKIDLSALSQMQVNDAQARKLDSERKGQDIENEIRQFELDKQLETYNRNALNIDAQTQEYLSNVDKNISDARLSEAKLIEAEKNADYVVSLTNLAKQEFKNKGISFQHELDLIDSIRHLNLSNLVKSRIEASLANAYYNLASKLTNKQIELFSASIADLNERIRVSLGENNYDTFASVQDEKRANADLADAEARLKDVVATWAKDNPTWYNFGTQIVAGAVGTGTVAVGATKGKKISLKKRPKIGFRP